MLVVFSLQAAIYLAYDAVKSAEQVREAQKAVEHPSANSRHSTSFQPDTQSAISARSIKMNSLVAKYSRPAYERNEPLEDESAQDMTEDPWANLSLKFAMPPVTQVR